MEQPPATAGRDATRTHERVHWLDGLRGAAAMFVVFHHMWLQTWPSYPRITGPGWLGWLLYGHLAVAVFIVVSGFSLALVPMRRGGTLPGGMRRFVRRRAWRILPAYWAALILSMIVTIAFLRPELGAGAEAKSLAVHGFLLQDLVGSPSPNGALWSIAVEWQIYFLFPLILFVARRTSTATAVAVTVALVLLAHAAARLGPPLDKIDHVTPQFLALFAVGVLAVQLGRDERAARWRGPLWAVAAAAVLAFVLLAATQGSRWIVEHFFTVDLIFGLAVACVLAIMLGGGAAHARRVLTSRVALWLGLFSYSIYLVHDPVVGVLGREVIGPLAVTPLERFGIFVAVGLPVILGVCYGFHLLFEAPFLRRRELAALRDLPIFGVVTRRAGRVAALDVSHVRPLGWATGRRGRE